MFEQPKILSDEMAETKKETSLEHSTDLNKYQCVTCSETFSHYKDLNAHIEIHNCSKCKICG